MGRVVGPDGDVQRPSSAAWRAADASVEVGVARRAPAEGQAFGQVAFNLPGRDVTAAVDGRQEGIHRRVLEEVEVLRGVLHGERQVEGRIERIADAVVVGVSGHAHVVQRVRRTARGFVGIRPTVVVVVEVLHQRWNARGRDVGHKGVGHAVTVGVHRAGRIEREGVRTANAAAVGGRLWSVADAVAVAVGVAWAGAVRQTGLVVVEDAVAVHVVVHLVADAVAVHVVRQAVRVERIAQAVRFHRVKVAVVVVVVVRRQAARTVRVLVGEGVAVRVHGHRRVEGIGVGSSEARTVAGAVAVAEAVAVGVRIVRVRADGRLVDVRQAVVVVVLVFDERVRCLARVGVVVGEFVGHAVAVEVFQNFEPEGGLNRKGRVRGVRPDRVGRVVHRFGRRAGDDAGRRIEHEACGQGG